MKSLLKMTLIGSAIVLALAGCDEKKAETTVDTNAAQTQNTTTTTDAATADSATDTTVDLAKDGYALGVSYANFLKGNLAAYDITLDGKDIAKGFNDGLNGQSKYTEAEIQAILEAFDKRTNEERKAKQAAQKAESTAAGDKFRAEFAAQPNVKQTESGLLYEIIDEGTGKHPTEDDTVIVHYSGTLVDGTKFDSSYDRGEPTQFPLSGVIAGWTEGIQLVGVGGKIKLVVPPELAYGDNSPSPSIPMSSTLVFEVELLGIDGDQAQQPAE